MGEVMAFHDQMMGFRIRKDYAEKLSLLAEKEDEKFDSTGHVIRVACIEILRKHGLLPKTTETTSGKPV